MNHHFPNPSSDLYLDIKEEYKNFEKHLKEGELLQLHVLIAGHKIAVTNLIYDKNRPSRLIVESIDDALVCTYYLSPKDVQYAILKITVSEETKENKRIGFASPVFKIVELKGEA